MLFKLVCISALDSNRVISTGLQTLRAERELVDSDITSLELEKHSIQRVRSS